LYVQGQFFGGFTRMSERAAYFDRDKLSWNEILKVLTVWLEYGDDPFEDEYSTILEELKNTVDEKRRARLNLVLIIMDFLHQKVYT
jgi:hypothetical protein